MCGRVCSTTDRCRKICHSRKSKFMALESRRMLILDFDGVLVDTEPIHFESWNRAFDELLGFQIDGDYRQLVGLTLDEIYHLWANSPAGKHITIQPEMKTALLT